jgi:hypothetical protein
MNRSLIPQIVGILGLSVIGAPDVRSAPNCDQIHADVSKAVAADPAKTLMIVEDALVINESCACEIVRAAISASKADPQMVRQIVQTAIAVDPKMAAVVTECAGLAEPGSEVTAGDVTYSGKGGGKNAKSVLPIMPEEPPVATGREDFYPIARDIRGVYLMAPGGVGALFRDREFRDRDRERDGRDGGERERKRRRVTSPISRSVASTR